MRKSTSLIALIALVAALGSAPVAQAAKGVPYKGKETEGGHKVTFKYSKGKMIDFATGVPMACLPIQGGGNPQSGMEPWIFKWVKTGLKDYKFSEMSKPAFHYNEVTRNHTVTTSKPARNGTISGSIRVQYQFMVPKYIPGTFSIYSCLGSTNFTAKPAR